MSLNPRALVPTIDLGAAFSAAMDRLGPFEPGPRLAVAVSGGADSMALAILARDWVRLRGGSLLALIVDHGLRAGSGDEARITTERLAGLAIPARILSIAGLEHGPALAERARNRRYAVLADACAHAGILHLLLGHHAADQQETLAMRVLRDSHTHGLAGMAALREATQLRLLRPLLGTAPGSLRQLLTGHSVGWAEDPSNRDLRALRPRLRQARGAESGTAVRDALSVVGRLRQREEADIAAELASRVMMRPEGFALVSPGPISVAALRSLIGTIAGASYLPSQRQITELAAALKPATLAGVRVLPAGRLGDGMLLVREEAAIGAPVRASPGAIWDGRFRLVGRHGIPEGATISKLGHDAARFRRCSPLPSVILRTLPALRIGETLVSVPLPHYDSGEDDVRMNVLFSPERPAAAAAFVPAI